MAGARNPAKNSSFLLSLQLLLLAAKPMWLGTKGKLKRGCKGGGAQTLRLLGFVNSLSFCVNWRRQRQSWPRPIEGQSVRVRRTRVKRLQHWLNILM